MLNLAECTRLYSGRPPRAWPGHPAGPAAGGVKLCQVSRVTGSGVTCQVSGVCFHLVEFDDVPVEENLPELRSDGSQVSGHDEGRREHGPHAHLGCNM